MPRKVSPKSTSPSKGKRRPKQRPPSKAATRTKIEPETAAAASSPKPPKGDAKQTAGASSDASKGIRLNRYIAQAGVCARRKADELIAAGRVKINGKTVEALGTRVQPSDIVEVGGRIISPSEKAYILLNKPGDTITTRDDERDRKTVMDLVDLPEDERASLFPVGRLDRHTLGVILLTNDGELAHRLLHPSYEVEKLYHVVTEAPLKPHELDQLRNGVELEDGLAKADRAAFLHPERKAEIGILLHEGRNRQIRRMFEAIGHDVKRLERVKYAGLGLTGVRRGKWRRLTQQEVRKLRRKVRLKG